jgi:hypothetical protein
MLHARVKTNFKTIKDWDQFRQPLIYGLNPIACLFSSPDVGLVGDDDKAESSLLEPLAPRDRVRRKLQIFGRARRIGLPMSHNGLVKHAVSIQEDATVYRGDQGHAIKALNSATLTTVVVPPASGIPWEMLSGSGMCERLSATDRWGLIKRRRYTPITSNVAKEIG